MTLTAVRRRLHLCLSPLKRLSSPRESVEEVAGRDARRVLVVVLGVRVRGCEMRLEVSWWRGRDREAGGGRGLDAVAGEAGLELLVGGEAAQIDCRLTPLSSDAGRSGCWDRWR